jgi:hypothetical protein
VSARDLPRGTVTFLSPTSKAPRASSRSTARSTRTSSPTIAGCCETRSRATRASRWTRRETPFRRALLLGSVEALWESLGLSLSVDFWDALLERYLGRSRAALGEDADAVWAEGRALDIEDAVELALTI